MPFCDKCAIGRFNFLISKTIQAVFKNKFPFYTGNKKLKQFMDPFYGWGSTPSRLEPLQRGSLFFTTKFPEIPGTQFINLGRMKG